MKKILPVLGFIALIPILIPAIVVILTYSAVKDHFMKCPKCGSKELELKGHTFKPGSGCRSEGMRRMSPCFEFYECPHCGYMGMKLFGDPLIDVSAEEFALRVPVDAAT